MANNKNTHTLLAKREIKWEFWTLLDGIKIKKKKTPVEDIQNIDFA